MARIAGVDLPRNKKVEYALPYIYGIGINLSRQILDNIGINPNIRVHELSEQDVLAIEMRSLTTLKLRVIWGLKLVEILKD